MRFQIYQTAFNNGDSLDQFDTRTADIPIKEIAPHHPLSTEHRDTPAILNLIFKYGQNEIQPQQAYSASVGDIIRFAGDLYLIRPVGFLKLDNESLQDLLDLDSIERSLGRITPMPRYTDV